MKRGIQLNHEQAGELAGKVLSLETLERAVYDQDEAGNFYLPEHMAIDCDRDEYLWVKNLPIVEYTPKTNN